MTQEEAYKKAIELATERIDKMRNDIPDVRKEDYRDGFVDGFMELFKLLTPVK